ncbi:MAG: COG4280 domain-containing protein [Thermomicrobiales bacterium]
MKLLNTVLLVLTSFLASAVEMVEALTIVLAVGLTRGWRSALTGVAAALAALVVVVAAFGPALVRYIPLSGLQVVIGVLLLIFGLQWLRKAVLRGAGLKAKHDETEIFRRELDELGEETPPATGLDWTGFVVSFKGVFLEGLEVAFIVLTFGANAGRFGPSAAGAAAAFVLVAGVGVAVHRPLSRVPENAIKLSVGLALTSFGTFWGGEGVGVDWTLGDWTLPLLVATYGLVVWLLITFLRAPTAAWMPTQSQGSMQ